MVAMMVIVETNKLMTTLQKMVGVPGTELKEGQEVGDPDNQNDDDVVILVNSPSHKAAKHSGTPLSTSGRDVGLAVSPARMNLRDGSDSQLLPNPDTLKLTPLMSAVAAQALIKSCKCTPIN